MPLAPVVRNGKTFDAGDVSFALLGYDESEVVELNYGIDEQNNLNFSLSRKATSYSTGKQTPKCSITLWQTAVRRLEQITSAATGGDTDLTRLKPFPITVTLFNDDQVPFTDIVYVKFQSQGRQISGTDGLKYQFDMFCLDIKFGQA